MHTVRGFVTSITVTLLFSFVESRVTERLLLRHHLNEEVNMLSYRN